MSELKPRIKENGIDYILVGDYYIPDLKLPEEHRPIGKYGRMHREYLREVCPARLHTLTLERDMRKEDLRLAAGMTTNMIANMSKEGKHISMDTLARICETLNCEITDVIELVPDEPASTGGKEHERIETKNKRKRN